MLHALNTKPSQTQQLVATLLQRDLHLEAQNHGNLCYGEPLAFFLVYIIV